MIVEPPVPSSVSVACRTRTLPRRGFLVVALAVRSLPASFACPYLVAPRPDYAIEVFRTLAARDTHSFNGANPNFTAVRPTQVTELDAEITRACGARKDGKSVEEYRSDVTILDPLIAGADAKLLLTDSRDSPMLTKALDSYTTLREECTARPATVVDDGIVLALCAAGTEREELVPLVPSDRDEVSGAEEQMIRALQVERMMIYGAGIAVSRIGGDTTIALLARDEYHRISRDYVRLILEGSDIEVPESASGHTLEGALSPSTVSVDYMAVSGRYCAQAWEDVLLAANNPEIRIFTLQAASAAAAGAATLGDNSLEPLPGS